MGRDCGRIDLSGSDVIVVSNSVVVRDLPISADIGVHAHEVGRPQRLIVTAIVDLLPPPEDRLDQTLDYNQVVHLAEQLGRTRIALIEIFARKLASALINDPHARQVDICVAKPGALLSGTASARIVLRRG